ncbi:hypothetical protein V6N12_062832 [Hibiscus sabdariffa]|uniref:Uncharacterized protein n=1 Tax=Hibiscus sabdariffa TaxID=183260 RepID=A0ABR2FA05_9ROSI
MGERLLVHRGIGAKELLLVAKLVSSARSTMFIIMTPLSRAVSLSLSTIGLMTIKVTGFNTHMSSDVASRKLLLESSVLTLTSSLT